MAEKKKRRYPPRGFARIHQNHHTGGYKITIPTPLARLVGTERLFRIELVEEGILLRIASEGDPVGLPSWLLPPERVSKERDS